jgi:hypothetical protein
MRLMVNLDYKDKALEQTSEALSSTKLKLVTQEKSIKAAENARI